MQLRVPVLLASTLVAAMSPHTASATTAECTPRAGTVIFYSMPGFSMFDDGRIVLGGVSTYNGVPSTAGVVLTVDGDIDLNLSTSIAPMTIDQRQSDILIESDGDIVMSGGFQVKNADDTEVSRFIARFDGSTGELDSTLIGNLGNGSITTTAFSIAQQSDGRLIVGGPTKVNETDWPRIGRLAVDGVVETADPTFATKVGADLMGHPYDIAVRSDDGAWVGGGFSGGVRLLGSDGTPVAVGEANAAVRAVLNHSDNSVLLGGDFTTFTASSTATSANRLVALNADGTPDSTFNTNMGDGANGDVWSLSVQSDGKILIGGAFTEFAGVAVDGVARLNADGTPDTAFNTAVSGQDIFGAQSGPRVMGIGVQPEGGIILFGYLRPEDADGNALSPGLARLSADGVLDPTFNADCPEPETPPVESVPEVVETPVESVPEVVEAPTESVPEVVEAPTESVPEVVETPTESVPEVVEAPTESVPASSTPTSSVPETTVPEAMTADDLPDADTIAEATPVDLGAPEVLAPGSIVTLTGNGFSPDENVVVLIAEHRHIINQVKADTSGTASTEFTADAEFGGKQTVVMWEPKTGTMKAQSISVVAETLPATGGTTNWVAWPVLMATLGALILSVRRLTR